MLYKTQLSVSFSCCHVINYLDNLLTLVANIYIQSNYSDQCIDIVYYPVVCCILVFLPFSFFYCCGKIKLSNECSLQKFTQASIII